MRQARPDVRLWTGVSAIAVAALLLIAVAIANLVWMSSTFGGTSDTAFFSAGGMGVAVFATFPWLVWVIAVGIVTIRGRKDRVALRNAVVPA